jgi:hypothetical protein
MLSREGAMDTSVFTAVGGVAGIVSAVAGLAKFLIESPSLKTGSANIPFIKTP